MKKLRKILVLIMMLIAWDAYSQSDTQKDSVVISKNVAKKILIELADYDRLIENKVEANLQECIEIQKDKDTVISYITKQSNLYKETLILAEKQLKITEEQLKFNKNKKGKGFLFGMGGLAIGAVIGIILNQ